MANGIRVIHADDTPILDTYDFWLTKNPYWTCREWIQWHNLNKQKYSQEYANELMLIEWEKQNAFAAPYNSCKYNTDFNKYFIDQGMNPGWLASYLYLALSDTAKGASQQAPKVFKWLFPVVIVGAVVYITYKITKRL